MRLRLDLIRALRTCFLRCREGGSHRAPLGPLFALEFRELVASRSLWIMLLLLCPMVGYGFIQAVNLYSEASRAAAQAPELARGLSPFDGILVPTFGALYIAITLLFPFVVIRISGVPKQNGAEKLIAQTPYSPGTVMAVKIAIAMLAWACVLIPELLAIAIWKFAGGHVAVCETSNLLLGHFLYGLVIACVALLAGEVADNAATAAIITLAATIGSWVMDFAAAGASSYLKFVSQLSLTAILRSFERGLFSAGMVIGSLVAATVLLLLAILWSLPGIAIQTRSVRSVIVVVASAITLVGISQLNMTWDATEDRRNSFSAGEEAALHSLRSTLQIKVSLAPEDPRYVDFERSVLAKLSRNVPHVRVEFPAASHSRFGGGSDDAYGEVLYEYEGRTAVSRSTSAEEILPVIFSLAGVAVRNDPSSESYAGFPLVVAHLRASLWFYFVLPVAVFSCFLWSRRFTVHSS